MLSGKNKLLLGIKVGKIRRATPDDVSDIYDLCSGLVKSNFLIETKNDIIKIIESSALSIVALEKETEELIGFLSLNESPNLPSVDPSAWEHLMWKHYRTIELNARNTMFVMLLCWQPPHGRIIGISLFESAFHWDMHLVYFVFIHPERENFMLHETDHSLEGFLRRVGADVRIAERKVFCPNMKIRRAVEEDNDDLVGMIESQSEYMRTLYGDFYISEFVVALDKQRTTRRILVAVKVEFIAVGGMMFNTEFCLEDIDRDFDLKPFNGLVKETGAINAYQLELFAMSQQEDERHGFEILRVSFELFPERDYCFMILPTATNSEYPILEHFTSVARKQVQEKFFDSCLYVAHRNSVTSKVIVREAEPNDLKQALNVMLHEDMVNKFETLIDPLISEGTDVAYVMLSEQQVVGVAILRECSFDTLPEYPNYKQCQITKAFEIIYLAMCPVIEPHSRWLAREIMRQCGGECLIWRRKGEEVQSKFMSMTSHFIPLSPPTFTPEAALRCGDPILEPLWVINRKLSSLPKVDMNYQVVVVGASRTGMAFISYLLFGPESAFLQWTNITLVSPCGLKFKNNNLSDYFFYKEGQLRDESLPFDYYVDVIESKMVEIDRPKQRILLANGSYKYYDYLIITCGLQYQAPDYLLDFNNQSTPQHCKHRPMDSPDYILDPVLEPIVLPENVFLINNAFDAQKAYDYVRYLISEECECHCETLYIIIYGVTLHSYCCVNALLKMGYLGDRILLVHSEPNQDKKVFYNDENAGVIRLPYCEFGRWKNGEPVLTEAVLSIDGSTYVVDCAAVFYYANIGVDCDAYLAINKSGVVYDGGIVTNGFCGVDDPKLFVAGPGVNYTRIIRKLHPRQALYNSEDIGKDLAKRLSEKLNPFGKIKETYPDDQRAKTAHYVLYKKIYCELPGEWRYLRVFEPGYEQAVLEKRRHYTMETEQDANYFSISIDDNHCVNDITCLARCHFNPDALPKLYGRHEKTLGNLVLNYKNHIIEDLFEFFSQPWTEAIYMDSFVDLMTNIQHIETLKSTMHHQQTVNLGTFTDTISDLVTHSKFEVQPHVVIEVLKRWQNLGMRMASFKELNVWWNDHRHNLKHFADIVQTRGIDF